MSDEPATSCRIHVHYGALSADCRPTENDIKEMFSVYGHILGMFRVRTYTVGIDLTPLVSVYL